MDKIDLRYQRGKIYTVRCYDDDTLIYVGSTIQPLSARMATHRCDKSCSLYKYVNGNWKNWYIELYEEFPCNNKTCLEKREGEITRQIGNINKCIAGRTNKEWYEDNTEYHKQRYEDNKKKLLEYQKQRYNANKKIILEKANKKYESNKKNILEKRKEKVICEHCGCESTKNHLKRHQQSKKCLEKQI